jgi:hypothetical protein
MSMFLCVGFFFCCVYRAVRMFCGGIN